jgi:hypothetical protein
MRIVLRLLNGALGTAMIIAGLALARLPWIDVVQAPGSDAFRLIQFHFILTGAFSIWALTTAKRDGALSEIHFHLSRGQPVFPSRIRHVVWRLGAELQRALTLLDVKRLAALGVEMSRYRDILYARTQEIGAAAAFLGFDGLLAPSARHECANLVVFLDNAPPEALVEQECEPVDWAAWTRGRR